MAVVGLALVAAVISAVAFAYAGTAETRVVVAGQVSCPGDATKAGSLSLGAPTNGTYYNGWITVSGVDAGRTTLDWNLTPNGLHAVDLAVVIVRTAAGSTVYTYDYTAGGLDDADTGLTGDANAPITGVEFCLDQKGGAIVPLVAVRKVVVGGSDGPGSFAFTLNGSTYGFEADGENVVAVPPGTYDISEPAAPGYTTTYAGCSGVVAALPQPTVPVCTITNTKISPPAPPAPPAPGTPSTPATPSTPSAPAPTAPAASGPIDVAITKAAPATTPLNGTVAFTLTVRNVGTTDATDVQIGDAAPPGLAFTVAEPPAGVSCTVTAPLVTCVRPGAFPAGASFTLVLRATATKTGTITNTATVVASGGTETNTADNTASASTLVVAPVTPPTAKRKTTPTPVVKKPTVKPTPKAKTPPVPKAKTPPAPARRTAPTCSTFQVSQKAVPVGSASKLTLTVGTSAGSARVHLRGPGIDRMVTVPASGRVVTLVRPSKAGLIVARLIKPGGCATQRVGVVGAFEPPLTG